MAARSIMLLVCAGLVATAIGGCGGNDNEGASSSIDVATSSLSKKQYVEKADEACREVKANLLPRVAAYERENQGSDADESAVFADRIEAVVLPLLEEEVAAVEELGAPAGDERRIEAMLIEKQEAIETVRRDIRSSEEMEAAFGRANREMSDYGLTACQVGGVS